MIQYILGWYLLMSLISFIQFGLDKRRARHNKYRIPEKTLILTALLGGSLGAFAGMRLFRHKTLHWYFKWGLPLMMIIHLFLLYFLGFNH